MKGDDVLGTNFTCGRSAASSAAVTKTATVNAGEEIGFHTNTEFTFGGIMHPGPAQIYMAKVPTGTDITDFTGYEPSTEWFKIASFAQKNETTWITYDEKQASFMASV